MNSLQVVIFIAYFAIVAIIGYIGMRQTKTEQDYFVAGGRLGWALGGASLASNQMSAGLYIGTIGMMYSVGWSFAWVVFVFPVAYWVMVALIAPRFTRQKKITVPDFIAARYYSQPARVIAALVILVAFIVYIQAQLVAGGTVANIVFGVPLREGMIIMAIVQLVYTVIGGVLADVYTDFVQMMIMLLGAAVAVPMALTHLGGLSNLFALVQTANPVALTWKSMPPSLIFTMSLAFFLGNIARPEQLVRFWAMKNMREIRKSIAFVILLVGLAHTLVFILSFAARALFPAIGKGDLAMPMLSQQAMPLVTGTLLLAAVTAAMMSTVDSLLVTAGSALSHDIFGTLWPKADETQKLWVGRIGTVIVGVVPLILLIMGIGGGQVVQLIVALFSAIIGAAFCVPVLAGVLWKRATREGAVASMIGGLVATFAWKLFGNTSLIDPVVPGFLVSLILMVVVSFLTPAPPKEAIEPYFGAN
ncbi:MAG TPA: sodium/solute symporter [Firmicutes bacterium]|nr:sodium/solute symporter [Bacillota bacterium]